MYPQEATHRLYVYVGLASVASVLSLALLLSLSQNQIPRKHVTYNSARKWTPS